ncbi:MAG TPA: mechanosensitive ion channel family protein [Noviherbaspirillum sp.]|nr:mechanosensitive ion channel family protein [Noviherbaspirillum sp.]
MASEQCGAPLRIMTPIMTECGRHRHRHPQGEHAIDPQFILRDLSAYAQTELGRIFATLIALAVTMALLKLIQRRASRATGTGIEISHRRGNFVLLKNLVLLCALIVVGAIWASKIAGAALSLAAVAGAMLLVSKEFLTNLLGSAFLTVSRLYRVGDFIELDGIAGRVIDTDLLATTVSEMQDGSQLTSRTVALPHSLLLVRPVRNLTATGEFVINLLKVGVDASADLLAHEAALLRAAQEVCAPWLEEANDHLKRIERRDLMDLPSAQPRVIFQLNDAKQATLSVRYCCRPNQKVKVEQAILRRYLACRDEAAGDSTAAAAPLAVAAQS